MDAQFFCDACGFEHTDPAEARLGYRVTCLDCALVIELEYEVWAVTPGIPAIAA